VAGYSKFPSSPLQNIGGEFPNASGGFLPGDQQFFRQGKDEFSSANPFDSPLNSVMPSKSGDSSIQQSFPSLALPKKGIFKNEGGVFARFSNKAGPGFNSGFQSRRFNGKNDGFGGDMFLKNPFEGLTAILNSTPFGDQSKEGGLAVFAKDSGSTGGFFSNGFPGQGFSVSVLDGSLFGKRGGWEGGGRGMFGQSEFLQSIFGGKQKSSPFGIMFGSDIFSDSLFNYWRN
jgi:hypothetical protein